MGTDVSIFKEQITALDADFTKVAHSGGIPVEFARECQFALQRLQENEFLYNVAKANPQSLNAAIMNVAATGLSLNPILGEAYLVPRDKTVVLDKGYQGIIKLYTNAGAIASCKAACVYAEDEFEYWETEDGPHLVHKQPPLGTNRGPIIGVYCRAVFPGGEAQVHVLDHDEIESFRKRSPAGSKNKGPWKTDYDQMAMAKVVKQGSKTWPKRDSRQTIAAEIYDAEHEDREAIDVTPANGNGVDVETGVEDTLLSDEQIGAINHKIADVGIPPEKLLGAYNVEGLGEIDATEFPKIIARLDDYAAKKAEAAVNF